MKYWNHPQKEPLRQLVQRKSTAHLGMFRLRKEHRLSHWIIALPCIATLPRPLHLDRMDRHNTSSSPALSLARQGLEVEPVAVPPVLDPAVVPPVAVDLVVPPVAPEAAPVSALLVWSCKSDTQLHPRQSHPQCRPPLCTWKCRSPRPFSTPIACTPASKAASAAAGRGSTGRLRSPLLPNPCPSGSEYTHPSRRNHRRGRRALREESRFRSR